jgi:hypothetical protein
MAIKFSQIFHCKTLKNYPNWFENIPSGSPADQGTFRMNGAVVNIPAAVTEDRGFDSYPFTDLLHTHVPDLIQSVFFFRKRDLTHRFAR